MRRSPAGERVAADDSLYRDAEVGTYPSLEQADCGNALLVVVRHCLGDAGAVDERCVDVVVTDPAPTDILAPVVRTLAAAVRNTAELLHAVVDQRAGIIVLITLCAAVGHLSGSETAGSCPYPRAQIGDIACGRVPEPALS